MMNVMDFQSIFMSARVDFEEWREKFEADFGEPIGMMQLALLMSSLPPGVHQALDQIIPDAHRAVMQKLQGGK